MRKGRGGGGIIEERLQYILWKVVFEELRVQLLDQETVI